MLIDQKITYPIVYLVFLYLVDIYPVLVDIYPVQWEMYVFIRHIPSAVRNVYIYSTYTQCSEKCMYLVDIYPVQWEMYVFFANRHCVIITKHIIYSEIRVVAQIVCTSLYITKIE